MEFPAPLTQESSIAQKKKKKKKEKKKKNGSSLVISSYLHGQMTPNLYVLLIQNIDKNEV